MKSAETPGVIVYNYLDYRQYLKDLYAELKTRGEATEGGKKFSFRYFSLQAGFKSPNYLKMVMDGDRNLTQDSVLKFCKGLGLQKEEAAFFENLVHYTQAQTLAQKNEYYQRMSQSTSYMKLHSLERDLFEYFGKWYYVAIREMVSLRGFRDNPVWISSHLHPNITISEAAAAVDRLIALGLLERKQGKLAKAKGSLSTAREVQSVGVANFHQEMIRKAGESIEMTAAHLRDIGALTVSIKKSQVPVVKEMVQNFRRQLHKLLEDDAEADLVYQINIQMFPLTWVSEDGGKGKKK